MRRFRQGHALIIGVANYHDRGLKLRKPITAADAKAVADVLRDPAVAAYPAGQVRVIPDKGKDATRAEVITAFEQLARDVAPDDTVFIFFCGHGVLGEDGDYYLTTEDTALTTARLVKAGTGLSKSTLLELLRAISVKKLLLVINACFSGHVSPSLGDPDDVVGVPISSTLGIEILATGEGRALITAARSTQYSYYKHDSAHTYFGQALMDGLRGHGTSGTCGYIGLYDLYQHVYESVRSATSEPQEPVLTILGGVGPFPVALRDGGGRASLDPGAIRTAPPNGTAVEFVERSIVDAVKASWQPVHVDGGVSVSIDQARGVIDFGECNTIGNVSIAEVAGRDVLKITATTTAAARVDDLQSLLGMIKDVRAEVQKLTDAPKGKLRDADHELTEAGEAVREGDRQRVFDKLESSQRILLSMDNRDAAAVSLAGTVGILLQRAIGLRV